LRSALIQELEEKEEQFLKTNWQQYQSKLVRFHKTNALPAIYYSCNGKQTAGAEENDLDNDETASRRRSADAQPDDEEKEDEEESKIEAKVVEPANTTADQRTTELAPAISE